MRSRWQPSLAVGHPHIDDDHRHIFDLVDRLQAAGAAGHGQQVLGALFCDLADYVVQHFGREERLMERCGFPRIAEHRKQHDGFLRRLGELVERHEVQGDGLVEETCEFLNEWLVRHVMGSDQALARYLEDVDLSLEPAE